jgi:hypothetical protein
MAGLFDDMDIGFGAGNVAPDFGAGFSLPAGATLPDSLPIGSAPYMPSWGSGQDFAKIATALGGLTKDAQQRQQGQGQAQAPATTGQSQSGGVGRPTSQVSLDALVRMLAERRNQYFTSAMSGRAQPVQQSNTRGLLGF